MAAGHLYCAGALEWQLERGIEPEYARICRRLFGEEENKMSGESKLVLELQQEEARLCRRLNAVREALAAYGERPPVGDQREEVSGLPVEVKVSPRWQPVDTRNGSASAFIRDLLRSSAKPMTAAEIKAKVWEEFPGCRTTSIDTMCATMAKTKKIKRVSKGVYAAVAGKK